MRRIGVYIDASHIAMNGGKGMRFDILRQLACRDGGQPQRLNVYTSFDEQRARDNREYETKIIRYQASAREQGYRLSVKPVKIYQDEEGNETRKSNTDLDMAVDILTESERLDTVLLVTGDGDFVQVVKAIQGKGCRVEVLGFDRVSRELRDAADTYINGYLVPNLIPPLTQPPSYGDKYALWGDIGSRVRGLCNKFEYDKGYGFLSFMPALPTTQILSESPTRAAYFSLGDLSQMVDLPSRTLVLEFELTPPGSQGQLPVARRIQPV